jgi:hypothetical protein
MWVAFGIAGQWRLEKKKQTASISSERTRHQKWRDMPNRQVKTQAILTSSISLYYTGTYSHHFCPIYHSTIQLQPTIGHWQTGRGQNYTILEVLPGHHRSCMRTRYSDGRHLSATAYQSNPIDMTCYSTVSAVSFTKWMIHTRDAPCLRGSLNAVIIYCVVFDRRREYTASRFPPGKNIRPYTK